jgi:hypothetical protein
MQDTRIAEIKKAVTTFDQENPDSMFALKSSELLALIGRLETPALKLSVCTYQNDNFDVMIIDGQSGEEIILSGTQQVSPEDFEILSRLAPACVWTSYVEKGHFK